MAVERTASFFFGVAVAHRGRISLELRGPSDTSDVATGVRGSYNRRRKKLRLATMDAGAGHCHIKKLQPASQKASTTTTRKLRNDGEAAARASTKDASGNEKSFNDE